MSISPNLLKRNVNATGLALAITLTLLNIFCLLLLLIAPTFFLGLFGSFMHGLDLSKIAVVPVLGMNIFLGIIITFIGGYFLGAVFATLYNRLE